MEIQEEIVDFTKEPEAKKFLKKEMVQGVGGMEFDLIKAVKIVKTSGKGKQYTTFDLYVRDTHEEYVIGNIFRENLQFGLVNPKRIKVTTEKVGEFTNWCVKAI